ncbi:MAG: hypothetical protein AB1531_00670 [Chloroflexota bacterium]
MRTLFSDNNKLRPRLMTFARYLPDMIFLILLSIYMFVGWKVVPFHGDESTIIRMSQDYAYLVQQHNFRMVIYNEQGENINIDEQHQRIALGAIAPLTIGLAWDLAGMTQNDINGFWGWFVDKPNLNTEWAWNLEQGNFPSQELLSVARIPSTLLTIISLGIVFNIA